ncbi:unnamed protein product [Ambrosiozyma monospora]|uniref:Homoserine kinase n=1 Tax=Ambrosiozyma monospora TaxID=43982 RepID=A0A9W6YRJ6_AMBMO|nr:unnamed protein product [Ambrosiozyma monospora]
MTREYTIKVPASSANIGPGFDVLGIGLNLYLTLHIKINPNSTTKEPLLTYTGEGSHNVPLEPEKNLVTAVALYVLRANNVSDFPHGTQIHVQNPIPLGRGLGSSGSAIVAGSLLGNVLGGFGFSRQRCLDYCLMIEKHPDNITASMMGGFVGSFLRKLNDSEINVVGLPLSKILPQHGATEQLPSPQAPKDLGTHVKYNWNHNIKCIAIIPQFEVSTEKSRAVLPANYSKSDVIFNLQRLAVLTNAVGQQGKPNSELIYNAMQDKLHQPYRKVLIPGLTEILTEFTPQTHPGLLGICLSGAGPTILCLADSNFDDISKAIIQRFKKENVECKWLLLEPAYEGALVEEGSKL